MPRHRRLARRRPPRLKPPIRTPHPMDPIDDYISGHADALPRNRAQNAQSTQVDDATTTPRSATKPAT